MFIYKSTDGGLTWSQPTPLHVGDTSDDKSWIACDNNPSSPHFGNIYVAWGAASPLRFARSTNDGASWTGVGNSTPGTAIADGTFAPEITVGLDGTVHIVWHPDGSTTIEYMRSTDGGETFEQQKTIVNNVHSLRGSLPEIDQWPHFPGANFRVITVATGCAFGLDPSDENYDPKSRNFVVAWSDYREQAARIYYRTTSNAGASFDGPANGQPVLPAGANANLHHFHPQLIATGGGVIGCAIPAGGITGCAVYVGPTVSPGAITTFVGGSLIRLYGSSTILTKNVPLSADATTGDPRQNGQVVVKADGLAFAWLTRPLQPGERGVATG